MLSMLRQLEPTALCRPMSMIAPRFAMLLCSLEHKFTKNETATNHTGCTTYRDDTCTTIHDVKHTNQQAGADDEKADENVDCLVHFNTPY
jgi:hypothetical protein